MPASATIPQVVQLLNSGRTAEAESLCRQILQLNPNHPDACQLLAILCFRTVRATEGETLMRRAISAKPNVPELHNNFASGLAESGRAAEAIVEYQRAIALRPHYVEALLHLGNLLLKEKRPGEAATILQRCVALVPTLAEAHCNMSNALVEIGKVDEAISAAQQSLKLNPALVPAWTNLGIALDKQGDAAAAIDAFNKALQFDPTYPQAHRSLANVYFDIHQMDLAETGLRAAIRFKPDLALAHWDLALVLLRMDRFAEAWPEYEWRRTMPLTQRLRDSGLPEWKGEPLQGRRILLHGEQGQGDRIQFVRYAPLVAQLGGQVVLSTTPELKMLFHCVPGVCEVALDDGPLPQVDLHCPIMSLPMVLCDLTATIPCEIPYLRADTSSLANWRNKLAGLTSKLRVGISFAGNAAHANDRHRSITWSQLSRLAEIPNVTFISLQKGPARAQLADPAIQVPIFDWTDELQSFADTAALMCNLDLIITVDSAPAHLAGALGRPTWLLLPFNADARWGLHRSDTPWYRTMRLFRQGRLGDWRQPIAEVIEALRLCSLESTSNRV